MNKPIEKSSRLRLHYLDGLRGLAALYVVFVHIEPEIGATLPLFWSLFGKTLRYRGFAVIIFIARSSNHIITAIAHQSQYVSDCIRNHPLCSRYNSIVNFRICILFDN